MKNIKQIFTLANLITSLRLFGAIFLIFTEPLSLCFYIVYSVCGFSDAFDGLVARKTNTISVFGSKLDSVADLTFYCVMLIKLVPVLMIKLDIYVWIGIFMILFVRLSSYVIAAIKFKKFASYHSYLNKITGALVFAVPYFINLPFFIAYTSIICMISMAAASEEVTLQLISKREVQ